MSTPGLYVAKPGFNAITDTNPDHFYYHPSRTTFKFIDLLTTSIHVTNYNPIGPFVTQTVNIPLPVGVNFVPFFFTYITGAPFNHYDYVQLSGGGEAYVTGNAGGGNLTAIFHYPAQVGGGNVIIGYNVYIFGNAV